MRKFLSGACLVLCMLFFVGCDVAHMSTLPELSKPYAAVYECEKLTFGGKDMLSKFEKITLDLGMNGEFLLFWRTAEGVEGSRTGTYEADPSFTRITFTERNIRRCYPVEKGKIVADEMLAGSLLHAEFSLP